MSREHDALMTAHGLIQEAQRAISSPRHMLRAEALLEEAAAILRNEAGLCTCGAPAILLNQGTAMCSKCLTKES